ncbi:MAG TPA: ABC transporter substrate-binding protein [Vicinamibacteria bacterium]|nr:ABC transporter substrate-binding protein [Vicinamibacteria bacterium]
MSVALPLLAILAAPPETLVVGLLADPVTLDPHRATDLVSSAVIANICETLVTFDARGHRPEPGLATTWATADNRAWTFTLRENVSFHDGTPFDAQAVVANIDSLRRAQAFPGRAERLGPAVVAITLERPNAAVLATLSQPFYSMVSPRALHAGAPVGTGPFRLATAQPGVVELRANRDYWGAPPRLARIRFQRFPSAEALALALRDRSVDATSALDHAHGEALRGEQGLVVASWTGLNLAFLSINGERAPFGDARVRHAVARAIDRAALIESLLGGHGEPARNPLPPSLWGYSKRTRPLAQDLAAARRLLAEAGLGEGFETTILSVASARPYMPDPERLVDAIRDDLGRVGIRARPVRVASWAEYVGRGSRGEYDMMPLGWQADTTDPNDFLSALLDSAAVGTTNRSRYASLEMDALLKRGRRAPDQATRAATYHEVQELFQRDMPWVPLYHVSVLTAHAEAVRGLESDATGVLRYGRAWKAR